MGNGIQGIGLANYAIKSCFEKFQCMLRVHSCNNKVEMFWRTICRPVFQIIVFPRPASIQ